LIDLDSGRERGRIWRIVPENFKRRPNPKLSKASAEELVKTLDHPNGWHRDTAARLLFERDDRALVPRIAEILKSPRPASRVHALAVLSAWGELEAEHIQTALQGSDDVLERELIFVETMRRAQQQRVGLLGAATSRNARVRHQLAWTISAIQPPGGAIDLLDRIISKDPSDPYICAAVLVAARTNTPALFERLIQNDWLLGQNGAGEFLAKLAVNASPAMLEEALDRASHLSDERATFELAAAVAESMDRRKLSRPAKVAELFNMAASEISTNGQAPVQVAAIHLLRLDHSDRSNQTFTRAFLDGKADAVRVDAFRVLSKSLAPAASLLWSNWSSLPTHVRQAAIDTILARNEGAGLVMDALKKSKITRADLTAPQIQTLRQHSNPAISRPALELLGKVDADRTAVIERFRPALQMKGDPKLGEKIYTERCAACHRFAGKGAAVGPDLESVRGNGREYLLTQLLDPNREVNTRYVMYVAELRDGDSISGILARETDAEVTLRTANAEEKTVPRNQIKRLTASPLSLMPVGLEEGLDADGIASLMDYLSNNP
jgi:putative heme-binding domain-containing protein